MATQDVALEVFKTGRGRPWSEHHMCCFCGTDRFFRPAYVSHLVEEWIPSITGAKEKLISGGKVADIGCGLGSTTILMAETYPNSHIYGYDFHAESIGLPHVGIEISQNLINHDDGVECISNTLKEIISTYMIATRTKNLKTKKSL